MVLHSSWFRLLRVCASWINRVRDDADGSATRGRFLSASAAFSQVHRCLVKERSVWLDGDLLESRGNCVPVRAESPSLRGLAHPLSRDIGLPSTSKICYKILVAFPVTPVIPRAKRHASATPSPRLRRTKSPSGSPAKRARWMTRLLLAVVVSLAVLVILMRLAEFASHRDRNLRRRHSPASILVPSRLPETASGGLQVPISRREKVACRARG
jgi:hypothetical protein